MVVRRFGVNVSDQTIPFACNFGIEEHEGLPGTLGGEFDGIIISINIIYECY